MILTFVGHASGLYRSGRHQLADGPSLKSDAFNDSWALTSRARFENG